MRDQNNQTRLEIESFFASRNGHRTISTDRSLDHVVGFNTSSMTLSTFMSSSSRIGFPTTWIPHGAPSTASASSASLSANPYLFKAGTDDLQGGTYSMSLRTKSLSNSLDAFKYGIAAAGY